MGIHRLAQEIANGDLTELEKRFLYAAPILGSKKSHDAPPDAPPRPINTGSPIIKLGTQLGFAQVKAELPEIIPLPQCGVGKPGGSQTAVHRINSHLSSHTNDVVLSFDFANAFNLRHRSIILREVLATPRLSPIWRLIFQAYGSPSLLCVRKKGRALAWLISACGVKQGCVLASMLYSLSVKPVYEQVRAGEAISAAVVDDFVVAGTPNDVALTFANMSALLEDPAIAGGLRLALNKCKLLLPPDLWTHRDNLLSIPAMAPLAPILGLLDPANIRFGFMPSLGGCITYPLSSQAVGDI